MSENKEVTLVVNGKRVATFENGKDLPCILSELFVNKIKYMSKDALINYLNEIKEMLLELHNDFDVKCIKSAQHIDKIITNPKMTRDNLVSLFYDMVLKYHGEATLTGYGYSSIQKKGMSTKMTAKFKVNPERQSLTKFDKLLK